MQEVPALIRRICSLLIETPANSSKAQEYRSQLKEATALLEAQQDAWNQPSEMDSYQAEARQSYRSRETDSADGFAEGLKLFTPRKRDSEKKKD